MTNLIVRCTNRASTAHLTVGKEYAVLHESIVTYKIFNDGGDHVAYAKSLFEVVRLPRQHSEEIRAWADGAIIQYRHAMVSTPGPWQDCDRNEPGWLHNYNYRVKPANPNADKIVELEATLETALATVRGLRDSLRKLT